jgi:putative ABC transport system permease protein
MFANYLKIAYRNLLKYKAYTLTNIIGLAVGIAATICILLYIQFELSYDNFHEKAGSIYRVSVVSKKEGKVEGDSPAFTPPIGPAMKKDFPEVENFVRLSTRRVAYLSSDERAFKIDGIRHADSTLSGIFSFEWLAGNPKQALANPYAIVLTPPIAERLFGNENPLNKVIKLDNRDSYQITGIIKAPPANSHIQFNALISFVTLYKDPNRFMDWDGGNQYITYVKLADNASPQAVESKFPDFMWGYINEKYAGISIRLEPYLQPLRDVHLYYDDGSNTLRTNLYIFAAVALLILFIACVNFVNLTTARATRRAKEVGVRKVLGAGRPNLVKQFLGESILLTLAAFCFAIFLVEIFSPLYQDLLGKPLQASLFANLKDMGWLLGMVLAVGIVAGCYPAFYLASFQPAKTLKGAITAGKNRSKFRNALVVLQFAISIALITCTFLANRQLDFMKQKELGFDKDNIVVLPLVGDEAQSKYQSLKVELSKLPDVLAVTASSDVPYNGFTSNGYFPEGHKNPLMIHVVDVDGDFLQAFNLELVEGRNFSSEFATDKTAYLINETLAQMLSWDDSIGKTIVRNGKHQVIGVVKDFHFATLHDRIEPLIITSQPWLDRFENLSVKIKSTNVAETMGAIKRVWQQAAPFTPFDYWFLDEAFGRLYKSEQRFQEIFFYFSALAIFIALLGLLSLASFFTEQRTKEIGIRKVLGASAMSVVNLLSKDFLKLVVLANLIAWPFAYYFMNRWLQDFAYRVNIGWWVFAISGALALVVALITVSAQALKAALANPVEALRYE